MGKVIFSEYGSFLEAAQPFRGCTPIEVGYRVYLLKRFLGDHVSKASPLNGSFDHAY